MPGQAGQREDVDLTLEAGDVARFVYCVVPTGGGGLGTAVGIEGRPIYSLRYRDIEALVHDGPAQPYRSPDEEATAWVQAYHRVVEAAWRRRGTVLPVAFNTIVVGAAGEGAEESLKAWLAAEYEALRGKLEAMRGKAEYGLQLFWETGLVARQIAAASPAARRLEAGARAGTKGRAYLYRQRLESLLRREMEAEALKEFQALYDGLSGYAEGIRVERTRGRQSGHQMIANLSCLVAWERRPKLEALVVQAGRRQGRLLRLVGPLPPYSFC